MCRTIRDKRLFQIHMIKSEDDIFEDLKPQSIANEKLYIFDNPVDSLFGGMFGYSLRSEEDKKTIIKDLEENLFPYKNDPWRYAVIIDQYYDTCNFYPPIFEQCIKVLSTDENRWFAWILSIPYAGIQRIFLQYASSIQCLLHFAYYLKQYPVELKSREYLISLLIMEFIQKLKQIDGNIVSENRCFDKRFTWDTDKWEKETDGYITELIGVLFQLPTEERKNILFSMLSNIWIYDERRNKFDKKIRDKVLDFFVDTLQTEDEICNFMNDDRWQSSKNAILHKLLIYVQWSLNQNSKSTVCVELLWKQIVTCLETDNTYLYYEQPDEQTLSWIFAKLLADEKEPLKRIKSILERYHQRYGIWNRNYENPFQIERARYFFLTVGAMSCEWLLRDEKHKVKENKVDNTASLTSNAIMEYIFDESQLVIDGFLQSTKDELNFLVQFWARLALIQSTETTVAEANKLLNALENIEIIDYRFTVVLVFLKNLFNDNKGLWFCDVFAKGLLDIINKDLDMLDHWNQDFAKDIKRLKERGKEICLIVG